MTEELYSQLERLWRMTGIPLRYMDGNRGIALFSCGYQPGQDPLTSDEALHKSLVEKALSHPLPSLEFEDECYVYGVFAENTGCITVLGPVCLQEVEAASLEQFVLRHALPQGSFPMKARRLDVFCATLAHLFFLLTGRQASETEIAMGGAAEKLATAPPAHDQQHYLLNNTEEGVSRFSYEDEKRFMAAVREGRPEDVGMKGDLASMQKVGRFAKSTFKHHEYMACSVFSVSCRAAIEGGLEPMKAYALSDLAKQRLERCTTISEILELQGGVMKDFAHRVKKVRETRSRASYIEKAKAYIESHLNTPIRLEDIAREIGINPSYLSRRFSQEVGVGIQKYIQQSRVDAAAIMLKYSDISITDIVNYLCFPSQSHFGKVFKERKGITPQKYRQQERLAEF